MGTIDVATAELAAELSATKWSILVLDELKSGARRYGEIRRALPKVSARMLTYTLRRLEKDGLVVRRAVAGAVPHVEYRLTPLGGSLLAPMRTLCKWAQAHRKDIAAARKRQPGAKR